MDIYKPLGFSTADRGLSAAHWPIGYRLLLDAPWPTCMLLCQRACYCSGACGAPRDKFREARNAFSKFRSLRDIGLQVQGPVVHLTLLFFYFVISYISCDIQCFPKH
jgi:hypothetical protein